MGKSVKKQNFLQGAAILAIATALVKIIGALYKLPLNSAIGELGFSYFSSAYELFSQWVSNQFTEKMFSSAFQRFAEELYGAEHTRSYHSGEFKNARSSMKGIRLRAYSYPTI